MSRLLEFLLGSLLITVFTVAFLFFSAVHYILRAGGADCIWYASAQTWIDSNRDGLVNPGESPLRDVKIHVDDLQNQLKNVSGPAITDQDGDVQMSISIPGCADTVFEIYVDIPAGYRITTRPRLSVQPELWETSGTGRIYYFGFAPDR